MITLKSFFPYFVENGAKITVFTWKRSAARTQDFKNGGFV
jgi:hypothetical protein